MNDIMISFIIPVYNCEKYVESCVSSILKLNNKNYEIILIDDGSTDSTGEICEKLSLENDNIRCFHKVNGGVSKARNYGIDCALGEYVLFLDSDDSINSKNLDHLLETLLLDKSIDILIYGIEFDYYLSGKIYRRDLLVPGLTGLIPEIDWKCRLIELFHENVLSPVWNKIIRRSLLTDNKLYLCEKMFIYEDLEFSIRCMSKAQNIYFSKDVVYYYRQSENEGNAGRRLKKIQSLKDIIIPICNALNLLVLSGESQTCTYARNRVLLDLYLILAREKINVSGLNEIRIICDEFREWYFKINIGNHENTKFEKNLINRRIYLLRLKSVYSKFRHRVAVNVKALKASSKA